VSRLVHCFRFFLRSLNKFPLNTVPGPLRRSVAWRILPGAPYFGKKLFPFLNLLVSAETAQRSSYVGHYCCMNVFLVHHFAPTWPSRFILNTGFFHLFLPFAQDCAVLSSLFFFGSIADFSRFHLLILTLSSSTLLPFGIWLPLPRCKTPVVQVRGAEEIMMIAGRAP